MQCSVEQLLKAASARQAILMVPVELPHFFPFLLAQL